MNDTTVLQVEHKGKILKIYLDDLSLNPREDWDNLGNMVCFHSRYNLGDKHDFSYPQEFSTWWDKQPGNGVLIDLYLYDHSGITMSTQPFSCPWDSGQVGWIYATVEDIKAGFMNESVQKTDDPYTIIKESIPESFRDRAKECLLSEVTTYDQYITGDVYGFVLENQDGNDEDSCWGFFGSDWKNNGLLEHVPAEFHDELIKHSC